MKKINIILLPILFLLVWKNVFAVIVESKDEMLALVPKTCPTTEDVIKSLDISNVSATSDHSYNIKKVDSFSTNYRWSFSVENIPATSSKEALATIISILQSLPSNVPRSEYYPSNNSIRSDCFFLYDTYKLHHLIQCSGFWQKNCEEQFQ